MKSNNPTSNKPAAFIKKLYKLLNVSNNQSAISWLNECTGFVIKDQFQFVNTILPQYFKHKNLSSFIRQLNMYGFHKLRENYLEFSHPLFVKGQTSSLHLIRRRQAELNVNKEAMQSISLRLERFQTNQKELESKIEDLEKVYSNIIEQNQLLVDELVKSKEREKFISEIIGKYSSEKKKNEVSSDSQEIDLGEFSELGELD